MPTSPVASTMSHTRSPSSRAVNSTRQRPWSATRREYTSTAGASAASAACHISTERSARATPSAAAHRPKREAAATAPRTLSIRAAGFPPALRSASVSTATATCFCNHRSVPK
eukprot:scaffold56961_cov26-Tisochrysis_lutea.AAC.2